MDAIGRMRRRLSLQTEVRVADGAGGAASTWTEVAQVFAAVEGLDGDEAMRGMRGMVRTRYRVTLRYRADVEAGRRFLEGTRVLTIRAAFDPDGTKRRIVCQCEEEQ